MSIEPAEDIAKAICSDKFDRDTGEISASVFTRAGSSVSRLSLCSPEDTWDLFRQRVEKPPARTLERIGVINVRRLGEIGRDFKSNPTAIAVEAVPLDGYPSHAEIPQKISRGLANEIVRNLDLKKER